MIVLKCDNCKKETEMVFEILLNQRPYTLADMFKKEPYTPINTKRRYLCDKCYEQVMSFIYPQGIEE